MHLIKNIRKNLLAAKKFIFLSIDFVCEKFSIHLPGAYFSKSDLHHIYKNDLKEQANSKQAVN